MNLSPILILHISAGAIALFCGAAAMILRKGARLHRSAGNVFFISMLIVAVSAMLLSVMIKHEFPFIPIIVFYLVATSWATIKRPEGKMGSFEVVSFLLISTIAVGMITLGFDPSNSEEGSNESGLYFFFGGVAALAAILDLNMIVRGGIFGGQRIARHLWRMCFSMGAAVASFLAQEEFIPKMLLASNLLWVPLLLVFVMMIYWLLRVLFTGLVNKLEISQKI